ncbi:MAG TPA: PKD domain-containing protein [Bacillales bacterium]|nr:PKD domain-containing protein [Bacillales bacterium]
MYYNKDTHSTLGFMANNPYYYYGGYCYYYSSSKPCVPPDHYYGVQQPLVNDYAWRLISYGWDEPRAVNADTWARKGYASKLVRYHGSYWWRSESGRLNKYRRGVWIKYKLYVYQHKYRQKYRGTIHLPDYIDHYYSRYWKVYVKYTGRVSKLNLTATRIQILDMNNHPVTFLHKGNRYKIRLTYKNTGTANFYTYTDRFYENGSFLGDVSLNYRRNGILRPGQSKTVYLPFTEKHTGRRTFKAIVNVGSYRNESNPNDNDISVSLLVENRPPVVDFTASPNPTNRLTTVQFTSHASDPDHDPITYDWFYQKSRTSRWVHFSTSVNPRFRFSQVGSYRVRVTVTDNFGKQGSAIHWITVRDLAPNARFRFSPTTVYEGDSLKIINDSTDPEKDSLKANWTITSPSGKVTEQHSWNAQINGLKAGTYRVHLQVTDSYGVRDGVTKTITVKTLTIHGFVNHTTGWKKIHQAAGDLPDEFYSGETFLLSAQVTHQPIRAVTVRFIGDQINGNQIDVTRSLSANPFPTFKGKLYDPRFSDPQQLLSTGIVYFQFKAVWKNGTVKTCIVPVHIIGDVYQVFFYHRTS